MLFPDANMFLDIGGNRGYTAAKIFNLWSPGHKFNGKTLLDAIKEDYKKKITDNGDNMDTVCLEGVELAPYICLGKNPLLMGQVPAGTEEGYCGYRRAIKVISFDGQESHVINQRKTIYKHFPHLHPEHKG